MALRGLQKEVIRPLIGYIHYEAPEEEQNFATLLEMLNSMDVREDDEEYQNPVDILFERLREKNPVRQYVKFKMAAGDATMGEQSNQLYIELPENRRYITA